MNHIVIIGFMGSGKTRVGKSLSQELGLPFVDVDKAIAAKMGLSVKEIYDRFGEPFYRALETLMLKDLCADKVKKVISLGAGLPVQEQNKEIIPELGTVIYIKGSAATLKKRLDGNGNPLVEGEDGDEKLKRVLKQRDPVYAGFADIIVITGEKPFEDLVSEILAKLAAMNGQVKKPAGAVIEPEEAEEPEKAPSGKQAKASKARGTGAKASRAKAAETKASGSKASDEKAFRVKTSGGKASEGKASEGKASEGKASEGKASGGKASGAKTSEAKVSEVKASEGKASEVKASEAKPAKPKATRKKEKPSE